MNVKNVDDKDMNPEGKTGGGRRGKSVGESVSEMIGMIPWIGGQEPTEGNQCEHEWTAVRMVKFAGARETSEVVRCLKCGASSVVEKAG